MQQVNIKSGTYRNEPIKNVTLPLLKPLQQGKKGLFVTVNASALLGDNRDNIRILVDNESDIEVVDTTPKSTETDDQAIERIRERFEILDTMTDAVAQGVARGLIISGPPGVGKSFGVETILDTYEAEHKLRGGKGSRTEVVKGSMTPIGLYQTLYMNSSKGDITVFDDCDTILFDEVCLNMLKAVLDSGKKRMLSWKSESAALRREGIPDRFEFKGGVIFITNLSFENVRSKKIQDHLNALMSRCHYIDLEMDSIRDRFLRIDQIVRDGMLKEYNFGDAGNAEIINFMRDNSKRLREISLRMVLKIADLRKMSLDNWKGLARSTCMKRI